MPYLMEGGSEWNAIYRTNVDKVLTLELCTRAGASVHFAGAGLENSSKNSGRQNYEKLVLI